MATEATDLDIVTVLRRNPEKGFRMLMKQYGQPIYWHIRRLVVTHADAQDATQETFVRVFRSIDQLKDNELLRAWVYRIATNEALRLIGRHRNEQISIDTTDQALQRMTADNYVDYSNLEAVRLQRAIRTLPTKQQLAFNMRYYDEMSYDDIAQATGSTPANVKANYHIAKEKIIKYMNSND